jgi:hypothetical protein
MEIDCLQRNDTFKSQITLDRHITRPRLNYYVFPDPSHFSLPSTFKKKNMTCFHFASDFVFPFNFASNFSIGFKEIKRTKKRKPYILGYSVMLLLACSTVLDISSIPPLLASLLLLAFLLWWCGVPAVFSIHTYVGVSAVVGPAVIDIPS